MFFSMTPNRNFKDCIIGLSCISLLILITLTSCSHKTFHIAGQFENAKSYSVRLEKIDLKTFTGHTIIDTTSNELGVFNLEFKEKPAPGVYRVGLDNSLSAYVVIDKNDKSLNLGGDIKFVNRGDYYVTGSKLSDEIQKTEYLLNSQKISRDKFKELLTNQVSPLPAYVIARKHFRSARDVAIHKTIYTRLQNQNYEFLGAYEDYILKQEHQLELVNIANKLQPGKVAPAIILEDPEGKIRKLSDLKGQLVLVDFWASWCRPCRNANPKLVEVYKKYKDKGFNIFSVSLDGLDERTKSQYPTNRIESQMKISKKSWIDAIKNDSLIWTNHVSELKKWDSSIVTKYNVTSIPRKYLIDRDGKIITRISGDLEQTIRKYI